MKKTIFVLTSDKYPNENAGAIRTHMFCKIFKELGYRPIVIGMGSSTNFSKEEFEDVEYYSTRYSSNNIFSKICSWELQFLNTKKIVLKNYDLNEIFGIMFVSGRKSTIKWIKKLNVRYSIRLYYDAVEWYSKSEFKHPLLNSAYKFNNELNSKYINKQFNVISISSYFNQYFKSKNINSIRVPVILENKNVQLKSTFSKKCVKIVYAGQMGNKDKIINFIYALNKLNKKEQEKIKMFIIGPNIDDFETKISKDLINKSLYFTGRLSRKEVLKHLIEADFTILVRPPKERYTQAGFPTKVVESLSCGTPVICNYTSDLNLYLKNDYNSIIIANEDVESCKKGLLKAINYNEKERQRLMNNSYLTFKKNFAYNKYIDKMKEFIEGEDNENIDIM